MTEKRKGILERLAEGPVLGDGGFCFALEKRGYVKAAVFTPECTVNHPEAVRQLHREFLRAGADVMQAFTFSGTEDFLATRWSLENTGKKIDAKEMNRAAYKLAREVADTGDALVSVSITETLSYRHRTKGTTEVLQEFRGQLQYFKDCDVDFIICEFIPEIAEMEIAIAAAKETGKPVAATMCVGPHEDMSGVPTGECAVRMAKAGADLVGVNCSFGPNVSLKSMRVMKDALDKADLKPYLMCQSLALHTPDIDTKKGYLHTPELFLGCVYIENGLLNLISQMHTPEHFLAYEPRVMTRFEAQKYAREAYELGIRYIGGCCGFEPYHIRAMSEELTKERGKVAEVTKEFDHILSGLETSPRELIRNRSSKDIWRNLEPSTGRPKSTAFAKAFYF